MSWAEELYRVYENNCGKDTKGGSMLLPIAHSTANAQITLTVNDKGDFVTAEAIDKSNAVTVIPVTEDSGARANGISPMPLDDKLVYIAKDYKDFASGKRADNSDYFGAYMEQLKCWAEGKYSHPAVRAIYTYLEKGSIMHDLIACGVLKLDEGTGKLAEKEKIAGIAQGDAFVRFRVNYLDDLDAVCNTWEDRSLYDSFISFNSSIMGNEQLCYATGRVLPATYKHPSKIRNSGDKAKLISSNDESGFTYRGRFRDKEEALSVSYDFSQKMHNALKWLLTNQGFSLGTLSITVWASAMEPVPNIMGDSISCYNDEFPDDDEEDITPDTEKKHAELVEKMVFGYQEKYSHDSKVMIMGVDAATTGRLSVAMYSELEESAFFNNIEKWHKEAAWIRFDPKRKVSCFRSFSPYDITKCAFGTEQSDKLECKKELMTETVLRLIPCVTEDRPVPRDIVSALFHKASNPLAYDKSYNHRAVLEAACGMIRKYNLENGGITAMGYDPNETDRSYLFGCLLAIADAAESSAYEQEDKGIRVTNARRYWNSFSAHPCRTWKVIEERLLPYINKLGTKSIRYEKFLQEIKGKMSLKTFNDDSPLEPAYLLGYSHFMSKIYTSDKNDTANNEEE
ncbi:MAG: type I-C CRISPR-associated protein Cas8c/Csd1 [Oscillospiraceae bacterium]